MEKAAATRRPSPLLPPTPVAAVAVQGHALVLKEARVGSRRRLNLDTMMSRRPYHVVFDLLVSDASTSPPETIHRSYAQFQALHHQLRKKYPRSPLVALPSMKLGRFDSAYIQLKYPELEQFLQQLLSLECISTSDLLSRFFREPTLAASDGSDDDDVLPPSDATTVTIRKGQSYSVSLEIPTAHAAVAYQFATRKHDIGFSITLNDDTLQVYSREAALKGLVRCPTPGLCTLTWDNSYVWHRSKVVTYHAEVVTMSPRSQSPKPRSAETSRVSDTSAETPTGYIAHVHRAPILLSPRRLVHTSMRKIIGWSKPEPWLKAGPMIIQRRHTKLKHALLHGGGESWYRKWFTLDGNNGILRCYDNQASVTREGPQGRLKLASAEASLSVVDARHLHGPTPFVFTVSRGKVMWILCTESEDDFVSWRQAISKSIFLVSWATKHDMGTKSDDDDDEVSENDDGDDDDDGGDEETSLVAPLTDVLPTTSRDVLALGGRKTSTLYLLLLVLNAIVGLLMWSHWILFWSIVVAFNGIVVYHVLYESDDEGNATKKMR